MSKQKSIWIFGDYRNYFQNRVILQLISRAGELSRIINAEVCGFVPAPSMLKFVQLFLAMKLMNI